MLAPGRRPIAMRMARSSSRRPQPDIGSACSLRNDLYCVEWGVKLYSLTHCCEVMTLSAAELCLRRRSDCWSCTTLVSLMLWLCRLFGCCWTCETELPSSISKFAYEIRSYGALQTEIRVDISSYHIFFFRFDRDFIMVVYREPVTGPRSRGIVNRHSAINNNLETKCAPKPNPNPNPSPNPNP